MRGGQGAKGAEVQGQGEVGGEASTALAPLPSEKELNQPGASHANRQCQRGPKLLGESAGPPRVPAGSLSEKV